MRPSWVSVPPRMLAAIERVRRASGGASSSDRDAASQRVGDATGDHVLGSDLREDVGPQHRIAFVGQDAERLLEGGDRIRARIDGQHDPLVAEEPCYDLRLVRVGLCEGQVDRGEGAGGLAGVPPGQRGVVQQLDVGGVGGGRGVGHAIPELERTLPELCRARVGEGGPAQSHPLERRPERLVERVRLHPVERDEHGTCGSLRGVAGAGLERPCVAHVHPTALAGQQLCVDGLSHERVPEVVFTTRDHEDAGVDRLTEGDVELGGGQPGDLGQDVVVDPAAARGQHPHHLLRPGAERLVPAEQQLSQGVGNRSPVAALHNADELLDEERDALAALEQCTRVVGAGCAAQELARLRAHLGGRKTRQHHPGRAPVALELGEERP